MDSKHLPFMTSRPRRTVWQCIQLSQWLVWQDHWLWCDKKQPVAQQRWYLSSSLEAAFHARLCPWTWAMKRKHNKCNLNYHLCLKSHFIVVFNTFQVNLGIKGVGVVYTVCFAQTEHACGGPVCLPHYWSVFSSEFISGCDWINSVSLRANGDQKLNKLKVKDSVSTEPASARFGWLDTVYLRRKQWTWQDQS